MYAMLTKEDRQHLQRCGGGHFGMRRKIGCVFSPCHNKAGGSEIGTSAQGGWIYMFWTAAQWGEILMLSDALPALVRKTETPMGPMMHFGCLLVEN
jgi:hypothetical protein